MMNDLVTGLLSAGLCCKYEEESERLLMGQGKGEVGFRVRQLARSPRPSEIRDASLWLGEGAHGALLVAPFIGDKTAGKLRSLGWSWADSAGNWHIEGPGLLLQRRVALQAPSRAKPQGLPTSGKGLALLRYLIALPTVEISPTQAARWVGMSQPRVSQVLAQLVALGLASHPRRGKWEVEREGLLSWFLDNYPGPGSCATYYAAKAEPLEVATRLVRETSHGDSLLFSGDFVADLLTPCRHPSHLVVYAEPDFEPGQVAGERVSDPEQANVQIVHASDSSIQGSPLVFELEGGGGRFHLADPTQVLWDQVQLGGEQREESTQALRQWVLHHSPL